MMTRHGEGFHKMSVSFTTIPLFEVDVEVRVRRTVMVRAWTEEQAIGLAAALTPTISSPSASAFLKWTDGAVAYRPMPVETIVGDDAKIVAVREVKDDGERASDSDVGRH